MKRYTVFTNWKTQYCKNGLSSSTSNYIFNALAEVPILFRILKGSPKVLHKVLGKTSSILKKKGYMFSQISWHSINL